MNSARKKNTIFALHSNLGACGTGRCHVTPQPMDRTQAVTGEPGPLKEHSKWNTHSDEVFFLFQGHTIMWVPCRSSMIDVGNTLTSMPCLQFSSGEKEKANASCSLSYAWIVHQVKQEEGQWPQVPESGRLQSPSYAWGPFCLQRGRGGRSSLSNFPH